MNDRNEQELTEYLQSLTFDHGRKLPVIEDVYHAGIGFYYVSFRRQLKDYEIAKLRERFDNVDLVVTVHKSRYPRYRMF